MPVRQFSSRAFRAALVGAALAGFGAAPAMAEDAPKRIGVELNAVAATDKACRLSFLVENDLGVAIDDLALELVLFDKDGRVDRFVVVRTGRLPLAKRRVKQFDVPEVKCDSIGSVLVNDVSECTGAGLDATVCLDRLAISSRAAIGFSS